MPPKKAASATPAVHLRRLYVDCRYGQLHLRTAFSGNGGFDELTPLVCIPPPPMTGQAFDGLLRQMGTDRTVYALDLPGSGGSDPAPPGPTEADHAAAIGDFLDQLRLRRVDLLGYRAAAGVAEALAIARPQQVRRVVTVGAPASGTRPLLPEARCIDLPDRIGGQLEAAPDLVAGRLRDFLDAT